MRPRCCCRCYWWLRVSNQNSCRNGPGSQRWLFPLKCHRGLDIRQCFLFADVPWKSDIAFFGCGRWSVCVCVCKCKYTVIIWGLKYVCVCVPFKLLWMWCITGLAIYVQPWAIFHCRVSNQRSGKEGLYVVFTSFNSCKNKIDSYVTGLYLGGEMASFLFDCQLLVFRKYIC